jgi:hypothetical protein
VADHLHRNRPGHTRAFQIAHCGAAEVVKDPTRHTGGPAGRSPRAAEGLDRQTGPVKHVGNDPAELSGQGVRAPRLKKRVQLWSKGEHPAGKILGRTGFKPH